VTTIVSLASALTFFSCSHSSTHTIIFPGKVAFAPDFGTSSYLWKISAEDAGCVGHSELLAVFIEAAEFAILRYTRPHSFTGGDAMSWPKRETPVGYCWESGTGRC
jgi:hypothetical protein